MQRLCRRRRRWSRQNFFWCQTNGNFGDKLSRRLPITWTLLKWKMKRKNAFDLKLKYLTCWESTRYVHVLKCSWHSEPQHLLTYPYLPSYRPVPTYLPSYIPIPTYIPSNYLYPLCSDSESLGREQSLHGEYLLLCRFSVRDSVAGQRAL